MRKPMSRPVLSANFRQHVLSLQTTRLTLLALSLASVPSYAQLQFSDASVAAGLTRAGESYGASWGDINSDGYPDIFTSNHRDQPALYLNTGLGSFVPTQSQVFTWTQRPGADTHGGTFADFDNDGDQDLFVTIGRNPNGTLQQFLVNERGALINKTEQYQIVADNWGGRTPIWYDGNFDGKMDFMMAMYGNVGQVLQQGNGLFTNVTAAKKFKCQKYQYGQLFDVNNDGRMELLCAGENFFPQKVYDTLAQPYSDLTLALPTIDKVTDTTIGDFDNDLRSDIFATRGTLRPSSVVQYGTNVVEAFLTGGVKGFYFTTTGQLNVQLDWNRAEEGVGFPRIKIGAGGVQPPALPFTLDPADPAVLGEPTSTVDEYPLIHVWYDPALTKWMFVHLNGQVVGTTGAGFSDGYFVITSTSAVTKLKSTGLWATDKPMTPALVMNYASGYAEDSSNLGLTAAIQCSSAVNGDFDNDMDLDIYLACRNGASNLENILYVNQGDGHFVKQAGAAGATGPVGAAFSTGAGTADSVVVADYDVDGFLDLYMVNGFNMRPVGFGGPDKLYHNNGNANHWIELDLVGTGTSTRDATGARVLATATGVTQLREQNNGFHRWSQNDRRIHFGLASATEVDLSIQWPNGVIENFNNVAVDRLYRVTQGAGIQVRTPGDALPYPCGVPPYDGGVDKGVVMWKDCGTGTWKMRMLAGNATNVHITGSLSSTAPFASVTPINLELNPDILNQAASSLSFDFVTSGKAEDGLNIDLAVGAGSCFSAEFPAGSQIQFGLLKTVVTPPFNLETLQPCAPALVQASINDIELGEGDGAAMLTVSLNNVSSSTVTMDVVSQNGTAVAGTDYSALAPLTLTFAPGETSKTVSVNVFDDNLAEGDETFTLKLSNPTSASFAKSSGKVTIIENEMSTCGIPTYSAGTDKAIFLWQDCPTGTWHFRMSPGGVSTSYAGKLYSDLPFTSTAGFSIEAVDTFNTTTPGMISYLLKTSSTYHDGFSVKFAPGARSCFIPSSPSVPVYVGAAKIPISAPVDLITMDVCPALLPSVSVSDITMDESAGTATFILVANVAPMQEITVDYATVEGTAVAGSDYLVKTGTATLPANQLSTQVSVSLVDNGDPESAEIFNLELSNVANATLATTSATATITDND